MKKNQTVQMVTPGQMKDIISAVVQAIPADMSFETAQNLVGNKKKLGDEVRKIFVNKFNPWASFIIDWQNFYRDVFGIETDFSNLLIPKRPEGFDRIIIMAQGMTPQRLYNKCRELFLCWKRTDDDLDKIVTSDRSAKDGAYAIWVRDRVEADEELVNLSANTLKERNIAGITLEERHIYELKYFEEARKHLDIRNVTLCTGSRCSGGDVPSVSWDNDELGVGWCDPDDAHPGLRSRQAVS